MSDLKDPRLKLEIKKGRLIHFLNGKQRIWSSLKIAQQLLIEQCSIACLIHLSFTILINLKSDMMALSQIDIRKSFHYLIRHHDSSSVRRRRWKGGGVKIYKPFILNVCMSVRLFVNIILI